jgi:hypothetical protein
MASDIVLVRILELLEIFLMVFRKLPRATEENHQNHESMCLVCWPRFEAVPSE